MRSVIISVIFPESPRSSERLLGIVERHVRASVVFYHGFDHFLYRCLIVNDENDIFFDAHCIQHDNLYHRAQKPSSLILPFTLTLGSTLMACEGVFLRHRVYHERCDPCRSCSSLLSPRRSSTPRIIIRHEEGDREDNQKGAGRVSEAVASRRNLEPEREVDLVWHVAIPCRMLQSISPPFVMRPLSPQNTLI